MIIKIDLVHVYTTIKYYWYFSEGLRRLASNDVVHKLPKKLKQGL
jgi:hypothetical protein